MDKYIPIESVIKDNQEEYYKVIQISTSQGKLNVLIEFMLDVVLKAINDIVSDTAEHYNHLSMQINN
jgi:Fic family protein